MKSGGSHQDPQQGDTLRLVWPQWQGAATEAVAENFRELPLNEARLGYVAGTQVLSAVLPPHDGPTEVVPGVAAAEALAERDGIEAKDAVLEQLASALRLIEQHQPARIVTLGGDCAVSVAPFAALAGKYGDDLAMVWIDSHPDVGTPASAYPGYHAMAVAVLAGHGDTDVVGQLPATIDPARVALAGLHWWTEDDFPNVAAWGISAFGPDELQADSSPLLDWLHGTGCSRVAIHLDVDVVDSNEVVLGLGAEPGGLTVAQVRRIIDDLHAAADIVGLTIAEYIPRQVMQLQRLVHGLPLLSKSSL
jgi:arginase